MNHHIELVSYRNPYGLIKDEIEHIIKYEKMP